MSAAPAFNLGSLAASLASATDPQVVGRAAHNLGDVLAIDFTELSACVQEWARGIPPGCSPRAADLDIEADHWRRPLAIAIMGRLWGRVFEEPCYNRRLADGCRQPWNRRAAWTMGRQGQARGG